MGSQILLLLKGLPASGKSTYSKELQGRNWKRVNKDDLRAMIDDSKWSKTNEMLIKCCEIDIARRYLKDGYNVVIDDTNFGYEEMWERIAEEYKAGFQVKFFDIPVMECIERDSKRGDKSVGAKVIMGMYEKYLKPKHPVWSDDKKNVYIFDIDGTLAKMNGRSPYDYTKVDTDIQNYDITSLARTLRGSGIPIIIVSGREDSCKEMTMQWLASNNIPYNDLFMRPAGDTRKDTIIKKEIYENYIKNKCNVLAVFDDRNSVIDMWRSLGLTALQVDYGFF